MAHSKPLHQRLARHIDTHTDGCWLWTGATNGDGYGVIGAGRRCDGNLPAHFASYIVHKGPVPDGLVLDHLCRNPACVNPDHLEPVTQRENSRRGSKSRLTADDVATIRNRAQSCTLASIAHEFGVHPVHIGRIVSGKRWPTSEPKPVARPRS